MPRLRRSGSSHNAVVHQLGEESDLRPPAFFVSCGCGWTSPLLPPLTLEEALRAAYRHEPKIKIAPAIELVEDDGGWTCFFCGGETDAGQVRLRVGWTEEGDDLEQWFAAHRACLIEHAAGDAGVRGGPLFAP